MTQATAPSADAPAGTATPAIRLRGLVKHFGDVAAVDGVDLDIADGEFFSMLGPSGSGKTTVLRLVAGFEQATDGTVELGGVDVTRSAPFERDVHTVFQDYALFPHMSVLDNVGYGLRVRGTGKAARRARAQEALDTVRLGHLATRRPTQALRRPAPAGRAGPGDRAGAAGAAPRRAARRARPQGCASRCRSSSSRLQREPGHHLRLRHPRPGGGADAQRPDRGLRRGADPADSAPRRRSTSSPPRRTSPGSSAPPTSSTPRPPSGCSASPPSTRSAPSGCDSRPPATAARPVPARSGSARS
ncbi:ATP-binding cassette domain-containing protein [Nocardioides convexus]|uniref:ABC transporter ATP-binding protein n=1 Tax=Nocardioides convexus TaxID=2712224 RepID=UPI00310172E2